MVPTAAILATWPPSLRPPPGPENAKGPHTWTEEGRKSRGRLGAQLPSGLNEDAAAILNFHVQAVAMEQPHTYERGGVGCVGIDVPGATVPEHGDAVNIEPRLSTVSQERPAYAVEGQPQLRHQRRGRVREPLKPVSITASISLVCPAGPCRVRGMTASRAAFTTPWITWLSAGTRPQSCR